MRRLPILLSVLALAAAGCGSGSGGEGGGGGGGGSATPADQPQAFNEKCGQCHTLAKANANGTFGPNLDDLKPSAAETLDAIRNGPGPMPDNLVEGAAAQALADYVAESAGS